MDFAFSEEQTELASIVRGLLAKRADSAAVRAAVDSHAGYDPDLWALLCDQVGVAALAIPEEYGGASFSLFESLVVLEEVGRSLAPTPLLATLLASEALLAAGDEQAKQRLLPRIAAGEIAALALPDQPVLEGDRAAILLAVVGDDLVEVDVSSTSRAWAETVDQTLRLAHVDLTGATTIRIGDASTATLRVDLVGAVGTSALIAGLAARAVDMTVAYSMERVQFGRPIGSFQALKHRMADMLVLLEMTRSASWSASYAVAHRLSDAEEQAHIAKSYCSDAIATIASETVQLHGGIAITWEHDAQLVFKRAHALGQLFGAAHQHRGQVVL